MFWSNNTQGQYASDIADSEGSAFPISLKNRDFQIYVQDNYMFNNPFRADLNKVTLVKETFLKKQKDDNKLVLNYASACKMFGLLGVYIRKHLIAYFGKNKELRPEKLGWVLFDYEFDRTQTDVYRNLDIVSIVISSNFDYIGCSKEFLVIDIKGTPTSDPNL